MVFNKPNIVIILMSCVIKYRQSQPIQKIFSTFKKEKERQQQQIVSWFVNYKNRTFRISNLIPTEYVLCLLTPKYYSYFFICTGKVVIVH